MHQFSCLTWIKLILSDIHFECCDFCKLDLKLNELDFFETQNLFSELHATCHWSTGRQEVKMRKGNTNLISSINNTTGVIKAYQTGTIATLVYKIRHMKPWTPTKEQMWRNTIHDTRLLLYDASWTNSWVSETGFMQQASVAYDSTFDVVSSIVLLVFKVWEMLNASQSILIYTNVWMALPRTVSETSIYTWEGFFWLLFNAFGSVGIYMYIYISADPKESRYLDRRFRCKLSQWRI